jgi:protoporphyrinogen oxidase
VSNSNVLPVAIIGGGILGLTLGWWLTRSGIPVRIFERDHILGGLAGSMDFDDLVVDRYYHVILPTDNNVINLAREVGVDDHLRFRPTKVGYYDRGKMYSLSSLTEFLRFNPLTFVERARLATFVLRCQMQKDWSQLDEIPLEDWLVRLCGRSLYEKMWLPLLRSKFDDRPTALPATYLWARTRRMSSTREATSQRESMGCLLGGYQVLADALADRIREGGGQIFTGAAVQAFEYEGGRVSALRTDLGIFPCRAAISTLLPGYLQPLLPNGIRLDEQHYLGIVCLMLKLSESLSPYYTINIPDRSYPFTTVVETTQVIGSENLGGNTLVYVPRYVDPSSPYFERSDAEVTAEFLIHLGRMFPNLQPEHIRATKVVRSRVVEPIHNLGAGRRIQPLFEPVPGLWQTSTAQIYPALVNCEAVIKLASVVFDQLVPKLSDLNSHSVSGASR